MLMGTQSIHMTNDLAQSKSQIGNTREASIIFDLTELLQILPNIILYLASGFIFLQTFRFISTIQSPNEFQYTFTKSLVVGFVLSSCASMITIRSISPYLDTIIFLMCCGILAYLSARIYISNTFHRILKKLNIRRTINPYIWSDIEDNTKEPKTLWVYLEFQKISMSYFGVLSLTEDFQRQPMIVLSCYTATRLDGAVVHDYTEDATKRILLDTSQADIIELIYDNGSDNIAEVKKQLDSQREHCEDTSPVI